MNARTTTNTASAVPCRRHSLLFTSERTVARARAAAMCQGCPVVLVCRSYSARAGEEWHVWGGTDGPDAVRSGSPIAK